MGDSSKPSESNPSIIDVQPGLRAQMEQVGAPETGSPVSETQETASTVLQLTSLTAPSIRESLKNSAFALAR